MNAVQRGFISLVIAILIGLIAIMGIVSTAVLSRKSKPVTTMTITASSPVISPVTAVHTATDTQKPKQIVDPSIKIEECKTAEDSQLSDFTNAEKQKFAQQMAAIDQTLQDKYAGYIAASMQSVSTAGQGSGITSVNTQLEVENTALQAESSYIKTLNQMKQDEYNRSYATVLSQYQQAIGDYSQQLKTAYLQCIGQ